MIFSSVAIVISESKYSVFDDSCRNLNETNGTLFSLVKTNDESSLSVGVFGIDWKKHVTTCVAQLKLGPLTFALALDVVIEQCENELLLDFVQTIPLRHETETKDHNDMR